MVVFLLVIVVVLLLLLLLLLLLMMVMIVMMVMVEKRKRERKKIFEWAELTKSKKNLCVHFSLDAKSVYIQHLCTLYTHMNAEIHTCRCI